MITIRSLKLFNSFRVNSAALCNIFSYPEIAIPSVDSSPITQNRFISTTPLLKMPFSFGHSSSSLLDTLSRSKLYEMRMFIVAPQHAEKFLKLTEEAMPLKRQHSNLIGYWKTEFGEINTMIQLWEYESYHECLESKKRLGLDEKWQKNFVEKAYPMLFEEENTTLRKITDQPLTVMGDHPPKGEVYYRWNTYIIKPPIDQNVAKFKELTNKYFKAFTDAHISTVCHLGTFLPDSDKMSKVYEFVRYGDMDDREIYKTRDSKELQSLKSEINGVSSLVLSEIMSPVKFSPLQ